MPVVSSELKNLLDSEVKKSKSELMAAKRDVEVEKILKELSLSQSEYEEFQRIKDNYRPTLYSVNLALDDSIVAEYKNRLSLFTLFVLAKNNVYMSGPSASGKTLLMEACAGLTMPDDTLIIAGSSEKAIFEQEREIKKANYIIIPEINKVSSLIFFEVLKSWGEGKEYVYRRAGGISGRMAEFKLPPKCFVFSRADESSSTNPIGAELMSRLTEITSNGSSDQTLAVLHRQAEGFENPFDKEQVDMIQRACLRHHISNLPVVDLCLNPAAQLLKECIPVTFTTARRTFPIYKQNADGIARFHWKDRLIGEIKHQSVLFVTPADMFLNHMIFGDKLIESALRCNEMQKIIMQIINKGGSLSKQTIQSILHTYGINSTIKIVESHLNHLTDLGYLDVTPEGRLNYYSTSTFYKCFDIRPNFKEIVEYSKSTMESIKHYKDYSDQYIERFCTGKGLEVTNPFDGTNINIVEYNWKSVCDVLPEDTRIQKTMNKKEKMDLSYFDNME